MLLIRTHSHRARVRPMHLRALGAALLVVGWESALHAAPPKPAKSDAQAVKDKCITDADEGQSIRDSGKLRDARAHFVACASSTCPGAIARECSTWLADVDARLPTVVVSAVDAVGGDLVDVKVSLDGQPFLEKLTGTQTPIDPGPHRLRFDYASAEGPVSVEEQLVVSERQKGRSIQAKFPTVNVAPAPVNPPPIAEQPHKDGPGPEVTRSSAPVAAYVVGGAGLLALGSFAFFAIKGRSDYNDLKDTCDPNCSKSDTDSVKTKFLIADISLGVGVAALGVATYLFLTHPKSERAPTARISRPLDHAVVTPTRGGGWLAGYQTRF